MDLQTLIVLIIELIGTIAFSISGAMVGIRRKMDIFGVLVLGVVTAVGGGMMPLQKLFYQEKEIIIRIH